MAKRYKVTLTLCIIVIVLLAVVVALQVYMTTGFTYESFRSIEKRNDIEKYTYTLGVHEVEYELPSSDMDFFSCVYGLRLYFPYSWISWKDEMTLGGGNQVLKVYMANGEIHTICPGRSTSFFGRELGTVTIDGVTYVTDYWYCNALSNMLGCYYHDRLDYVKEVS